MAFPFTHYQNIMFLQVHAETWPCDLNIPDIPWSTQFPAAAVFGNY